MTMRYYLWLLIIGIQFFFGNTRVFATAVHYAENQSFELENNFLKGNFLKFKNKKSESKTTQKMEKKNWEKWLPLGLGILGIGLVFIPYLSLVGLICGVLSLLAGLLLRKKYPKMARWGIWLGGLCVLAFLGVLGLILFF